MSAKTSIDFDNEHSRTLVEESLTELSEYATDLLCVLEENPVILAKQASLEQNAVSSLNEYLQRKQGSVDFSFRPDGFNWRCLAVVHFGDVRITADEVGVNKRSAKLAAAEVIVSDLPLEVTEDEELCQRRKDIYREIKEFRRRMDTILGGLQPYSEKSREFLSKYGIEPNPGPWFLESIASSIRDLAESAKSLFVFNAHKTGDIMSRLNMIETLSESKSQKDNDELTQQLQEFKKKIIQDKVEEQEKEKKVKSEISMLEKSLEEIKRETERASKENCEKEKELAETKKKLSEVMETERVTHMQCVIHEESLRKMSIEKEKLHSEIRHMREKMAIEMERMNREIAAKNASLDKLAARILATELTSESLIVAAPHEASCNILNAVIKADMNTTALRGIKEGLEQIENLNGASKEDICEEFLEILPRSKESATVVNSIKVAVIEGSEKQKEASATRGLSLKKRLAELKHSQNPKSTLAEKLQAMKAAE